MANSKEGFPRQRDGSRKDPGCGDLDSVMTTICFLIQIIASLRVRKIV